MGAKRKDPVPASAPSGSNPPVIKGFELHGRNANHYENVWKWRCVVEEHPLFANVSQEMPLSIKDLGMQRPFNEEDFGVAVSRGKAATRATQQA